MTDTTPKPLDRYRELRSQRQALQAEHIRQASCPSMGYSEQAAFDKMDGLAEAMERELDLVEGALLLHAKAAELLKGGA